MAEAYDITVYNNDTHLGTEFEIIVNSVPLDLTGASAKMQVRIDRDKQVVIELEIGSGLSIVGPATDGKLRIDAQVFSAVPDVYKYDIQITLSSGVIKTYIDGTFTIEGDITHNG